MVRLSRALGLPRQHWGDLTASGGAIYYGWNALSDQERNDIIEKLTNDLKVDAELIKSLIRFVVDKPKEFLSSENLKEIKVFVANAAAGLQCSIGLQGLRLERARRSWRTSCCSHRVTALRCSPCHCVAAVLNSMCSCLVIVMKTWANGGGGTSALALLAGVSGVAKVAHTGATVKQKNDCVQ